MSNPLNYGQPFPPSLSDRRPVPVTVIAIVGIALSLPCLFGGVLGMVNAFAGPLHLGQPPDPALDAVFAEPAIRLFASASSIGVTILWAAMCAGCVGALMLKPWARTTLIYASLAVIVVGLASAAAQIAWIGPKMSQAMAHSTNPDFQGPDAQTMTRYIGPMSACSPLLSIVFPVIVLITLHAPSVTDAFAGRFGQSPGPPPA